MVREIATLLLFVSQLTNSISQIYDFQFINNKNGLPQSQAYAICFDNKQHAWIGTQGGGIAIYDGIDIKYITQEEGLLSNRVYDLKLIDDKIFAACKGGVSVIDSEDLSLSNSYRFINADELAQSITYYKNQVFLGSNKGLYILTDSLVNQLPFSGQTIYSFFKENNGELWVCSNKGISQFNNPINKINRARGLKNEEVTSVVEYQNEWLIGTYGGGVWKYNKSSKIKRLDTDNDLRDAIILKMVVQNDKIWIATMNNGLYFYDFKVNRLTQFTVSEGLSNNNVHELNIDVWGNLWIGTSGGGVSIFNNSPFVTYNKSNGLSSNYIYAVLKDQLGNLWVGTQGLGVQKINDTLSIFFDEERGFKATKTKAIFEDSNGTIWLGTEGEGLGKVINNITSGDSVMMYKQSNGLYDSWIRCFTENARRKTMYIGTSKGIYYTSIINRGTELNRFRKLKNDLSSTRVNDLAWNGDVNVLLFASDKGVGFVKKNKVTYFEPNGEFRNVAFKDSLIWFGSTDKGVLEVKYVNDSVYKSKWLSKSKILASNNIYQLIEDFPDLWIGTEKGLTQYNIIDKTTRQYGYDEGFEGVETNVNAAFKDKDAQLWFGTTDGLFLYSKGKSYDSLQGLPPVFSFEDIQVFYQSILETEYVDSFLNAGLLEFKHTDNHLGFSIKAHHFTYQNKIKYRWKLDGIDKGWSRPSKNNSATFSNLEPGDYTLFVQASIDNEWDVKPIVFEFKIMTPFWQQNWFILSYILLGLIILAFLIYNFIKRQQNKNKALIEKIELEKSVLELEQKALRLQMNPHFIFNVLNSIHHLIILNDSAKARYALSKFSKLMRMVLENSRNKLVSIDDELDTIQNYVQLEKLTGQIDFDFKATIDPLLDSNELILPPLMVQPFIENAIIHGLKKINRKGIITVDFKLESENYVTCTIEDNGNGRLAAESQKAQKDQYHKSTALQVTQERLANLNNSAKTDEKDFEIIDLKDDDGNALGTKVIIKVKLP